MAGQEPGPRPAWLSAVTECWAWRGPLHLWDLHILRWGGVSSFPVRRPCRVPALEGLNKASPAKGQSLLPTTAPEARAAGRACGRALDAPARGSTRASGRGGRVDPAGAPSAADTPPPVRRRHSSTETADAPQQRSRFLGRT